MSNTILLADDDENGRKIFRRVLEYEGFNVIDASDGKAALEVSRIIP